MPLRLSPWHRDLSWRLASDAAFQTAQESVHTRLCVVVGLAQRLAYSRRGRLLRSCGFEVV